MMKLRTLIDKALLEEAPASAHELQRWVEAHAQELASRLDTLPPPKKGSLWTFDITTFRLGEDQVVQTRIFQQVKPK